ncbi:MAG: hypothetical protein HOH43_18130, partial [Candidatus Latescibacteria bacterium]|nr:hypothetical protein [Candidatus Latescibacterota bacterium]
MPEEVQMDWDLTPFFDSFNGKTMRDFKNAIATDTDSLRSRAQILAPLDASNEDEWLSVIVAYEEIETRLGHLSSYMSCLSAADARNEAYATEMAALNLMYAEGAKLDIELLRAVRDASDEIFESLIARNELKGTGFILGKMRTQAKRTMDPDLEVLAADLGVNGIEAWGALYDSVSGKLEFEMAYPDGRSETLPISQRRSLMEHSDRAVRMAAFEGGNKAWESMESVTAAALN